ncbi:MAG TPA: hypothetical protein VF938_03660 [Candidatus Angelobacter sp.]
MREIDPQSGDPLKDATGDARLSEALRGLAASSHRGAPIEIGEGLSTAFRRHHARRRLVRRVSLAAVAACLALVTGLMLMRSPHQSKAIVQQQPSGVQATTVAQAATTLPKAARKYVKAPKARNSTVASRRQFLALPGYDPAVPADELHVVRVQLPGSALWQMGAPVSPDSGARQFMADFVVSQDGTPYAVRLVQ